MKFHDNKEDSPVHFLDEIKRFKRGYRINDRKILENLDVLLTEDPKDWCFKNRTSWKTLSDFFEY